MISSPLFDRSAEHITRGDLGDLETLGNKLGLGALTCAWRA